MLYVINPAGHGGAGMAAWREFQALWPDVIDPGDVMITERAGHAQEIAASYAGGTLVTVGGDGTVNEVISGLQSRREPHARLAIVPAGTGNDIARNVGIVSVDDAVSALGAGADRTFDLVQVDWDARGTQRRRYAFLYGNAGFTAIPAVRPWMKRILGPTVAYYLGTLIQVFAYRPPSVVVEADGRRFSGRAWMVMAANVERSGGGSMCLAPGARADDGELNVVIVPVDTSKLKVAIRLFPRIPTGAHVDEPDVHYFPAKQVSVRADPPAPVELDGDVLGETPVTFTICPSRVRIVVPDRIEWGTPAGKC